MVLLPKQHAFLVPHIIFCFASCASYHAFPEYLQKLAFSLIQGKKIANQQLYIKKLVKDRLFILYAIFIIYY